MDGHRNRPTPPRHAKHNGEAPSQPNILGRVSAAQAAAAAYAVSPVTDGGDSLEKSSPLPEPMPGPSWSGHTLSFPLSEHLLKAPSSHPDTVTDAMLQSRCSATPIPSGTPQLKDVGDDSEHGVMPVTRRLVR